MGMMGCRCDIPVVTGIRIMKRAGVTDGMGVDGG